VDGSQGELESRPLEMIEEAPVMDVQGEIQVVPK
jgi:hypothetical protein